MAHNVKLTTLDKLPCCYSEVRIHKNKETHFLTANMWIFTVRTQSSPHSDSFPPSLPWEHPSLVRALIQTVIQHWNRAVEETGMQSSTHFSPAYTWLVTENSGHCCCLCQFWKVTKIGLCRLPPSNYLKGAFHIYLLFEQQFRQHILFVDFVVWDSNTEFFATPQGLNCNFLGY